MIFRTLIGRARFACFMNPDARAAGVAPVAAAMTTLILALLALPACAAGGALSFDEALRLAEARSPQLSAQRARADGASAGAVAAGALPDPKLKTKMENVPTAGEERWTAKDPHTALKVGVIQEIPGRYKRDLRTQRADDETRGALAKLEAQRTAVMRDVATAWLARRFAEEAEEAIADQIAEAEFAVEASGARYRAGKGEQAELIAVQRALVLLRNQHTDGEARAKQARIALARFIGADAERALGGSPDLALLPAGIAERVDTDALPEVRAALAQATSAGTDAALARAEDWPDLWVEASYAWRGKAGEIPHPGHPSDPGYQWSKLLSMEVEVGLPLFGATRQDPRYAAKRMEQDAARGLGENAKRRQSAEVEAMVAEWEGARAQALRIRDELIPLAAQRREAALAAYRGGTGTLAAVLDARRGELAARLALIERQAAGARAWAWLASLFPATGKS